MTGDELARAYATLVEHCDQAEQARARLASRLADRDAEVQALTSLIASVSGRNADMAARIAQLEGEVRRLARELETGDDG